MAFSPGGVLLVTDMSDGTVLAFPDPKHTGHAERTVTVLSGLNAPHGIAFHKGKLYVAEINAVRRYDWDESQLRASNPQKIADLPGSGGGHSTRTILFANGKMYVAAGSSCNVCVEDDKRRAAVIEFNEDGSGQRIFASGLRNAVGLTLNPKTNTIWATDNGRDWLGDDLPPEEVNDLGPQGGNFGWPYCYGDRVPDRSQSKDYDCSKTDRAEGADAGALGATGLAVLRREHVSAGISRKPVCDFSWLLEPQRAHRIQSGAHKVQRQGRAAGPAGRLHQRLDSPRREEEGRVDGAAGWACRRT